MEHTIMRKGSTRMQKGSTGRPRFDKEWHDVIAFLPYERQERFVEAVRAYQLDGIVPQDLSATEMAAFGFVKLIIDKRRRVAQRQREYRRRKASGCVGARAAAPTAVEPNVAVSAPAGEAVSASSADNSAPSGNVTVMASGAPSAQAPAGVKGCVDVRRNRRAGFVRSVGRRTAERWR